MPEISVHELAVKRENETLDLIARSTKELRETDERWMMYEANAEVLFNSGRLEEGRKLALVAYDLRDAARRNRREITRLYQELARIRSWLSHGPVEA